MTVNRWLRKGQKSLVHRRYPLYRPLCGFETRFSNTSDFVGTNVRLWSLPLLDDSSELTKDLTGNKDFHRDTHLPQNNLTARMTGLSFKEPGDTFQTYWKFQGREYQACGSASE